MNILLFAFWFFACSVKMLLAVYREDYKDLFWWSLAFVVLNVAFAFAHKVI
jgi:hypothetical protein